MVIRCLMIGCLVVAGAGFARQPKASLDFLYGAVRGLGWGPLSASAYSTGILRMGGAVIVVFAGNSERRDVTFDFTFRKLNEITDQQIESLIRDKLGNCKKFSYSLNSDLPIGDCLGYLLIGNGGKVHRYDYLSIDDQLEVSYIASLDLPTYRRSRLLATLKEVAERPPKKELAEIVDEELSEPESLWQALNKFKRRLFDPDSYERQVLTILNSAAAELALVAEQGEIISQFTDHDYRSSIALITEALQISGLNLSEVIQATKFDRTSAKQLTRLLEAHLQGAIVVNADNSQQLLTTLFSNISKTLAYRIPDPLRYQTEDQVQELFNRAEQVMVIERIANRFQNALRNRQHFYGQHYLHTEKINQAKQQIDDLLDHGIHSSTTLHGINRIRAQDAKASRRVLRKSFRRKRY